MGGKEGAGLLCAWRRSYPRGSRWEVPAGEDAVGLEMVTLALRVSGMAWGEHRTITVSPYFPSYKAGKAVVHVAHSRC